MIERCNFRRFYHCCQCSGTFNTSAISWRAIQFGGLGWQFWLWCTGTEDLHSSYAFKTKLVSQNAEQPPGRSTGITALVFQILHLLD